MSQSMDRRLFGAAKSGDLALLRQLHAEDPNILDARTPYGNTALHLAVMFRQEEFSKMLCSKNPSLLSSANNNGDTPLLLTAAAGYHPMVTFFILVGQISSAHLGDVESGNVGTKHMLMATNWAGNNAMHEALRNGHGALALEILHAEPELATLANKNGESPLYMACNRSMEEVVKVLLQSPRAVDGGPKGRNALHGAVLAEHPGIVKALLEKRACLSKTVAPVGCTPLHLAAHFNKLEMVQLLLDHDASLAYIADSNSYTPIMYAVVGGHARIVEEVIRHCPDAGIVADSEGNNALHNAISTNQLEVVKYILRCAELGSLVNQPNNNGFVPLHMAAWKYNTKILRLLLEDKRVDKAAEDKESFNAIDVFYKVEASKTLRWNEAFLMLAAAIPNSGWTKIWLGANEKIMNKSKEEIKSLTQTYTNNSTVVGILMATVTFAAAFTVPGGYIDGDGPDQGLPVLSRKLAFKAFLISDTIAMCTSLAVAFLCIFAGWEDIDFLNHYRNSTRRLLWCGFAAMSVAFATGLYTLVAPRSLWLAAIFCVLCCVVLPVATYLLSEWPLCKQRMRLGRKYRRDLLDKL